MLISMTSRIRYFSQRCRSGGQPALLGTCWERSAQMVLQKMGLSLWWLLIHFIRIRAMRRSNTHWCLDHEKRDGACLQMAVGFDDRLYSHLYEQHLIYRCIVVSCIFANSGYNGAMVSYYHSTLFITSDPYLIKIRKSRGNDIRNCLHKSYFWKFNIRRRKYV